jgi:hypothetical protein
MAFLADDAVDDDCVVIRHQADPSKETITEFAARWDRDWLSLNVGTKSLERYRQIVRLYVIPHIGTTRVQRLRAAHLSEIYAKLLRSGGAQGRPLAAATVGYTHRVLHRMLGHAATWGIVTTNVATLVDPPPLPDTEIAILTEDQIRTHSFIASSAASAAERCHSLCLPSGPGNFTGQSDKMPCRLTQA